ncbi:MAG: hypothetical protein MK066_07545, partial [Crocinitomicaceae bacterium]|nr:hypothetical protein [Crocinitomicaceae bacterium]
KDQLKELVIHEVNKSLNAELSLKDFDLTFISTFPNMTVTLDEAKLQGQNDFKDVVLMDIKEVRAHVAFWSVVSGDQVEIDEIHIIDPVFNVKVLQDGTANYDIVKPDSVKTPEEISEPSSFKLSLKEYSIKNAQITYSDDASNIHSTIKNLNHTGQGDLTADIIDFKTSTQIDELSYDMDGLSYLSQVKTDADINLLMEFKEASSKYTLKENSIKLNELGFSIDGSYEMLDKHDQIDLSLDASKATFKQFLSLIPTFFHSGYESMVSRGTLALNGKVEGRLDEKSLPGWDFGLKVNNASINYPDLPGKITNIQLDAGSKFVGGTNLDKMTAQIDRFHAEFGKNSTDATMHMKNIMTDPYIQSTILANVDLGTLKDFVPVTEGESYQGTLDADIDIKGRMSALEKGDFEAFRAEGDLSLSDMVYASKDLPNKVFIDKVNFLFSPENLQLTELRAKTGKSDFQMDGTVDNYFGYLLREEHLAGTFNFTSKNLDLDELMAVSETGESTASVPTNETTASSEQVEPLLIPHNVDFNLNTAIDNVHYNGIDAKNVKGNVKLKDEIATLNDISLDAMGGNIGLGGSYNTQDHTTPKLDFNYKLNQIDIHDLSTHFLTVEKLAPLSKYARGKITSSLNMSSDLTPSFEPILTSLSSIGDIKSSSIKVEGFELFDKIADKTKISKLSDQTLKNFYTKFKIKDGKISLTPFDVKMANIGTKVSGYSTLDKKLNYDMKMNVPKSEIPAEMIKVVEDAMGKLHVLTPNLNIGELPNFIPVNINVAGDAKNPKITTDFKEAILKATGDFKDDLINTVTETIKDTVQAVIEDKVEEIKEDLNAKKAKILADAQKKADQAKAEGKKAKELAKKEADKAYKQAVDAAGSNPLKKKAAEIAAGKVRDKAYEKADKLEEAGNKTADDIMRKAHEEADKLK